MRSQALCRSSMPIALMRLIAHAAPTAATTQLGVLAFTRGLNWNSCARMLLDPMDDNEIIPFFLNTISKFCSTLVAQQIGKVSDL